MTKGRTSSASYSNAIEVIELQGPIDLSKVFITEIEYLIIIIDAAIDHGKASDSNCYDFRKLKLIFISGC